MFAPLDHRHPLVAAIPSPHAPLIAEAIGLQSIRAHLTRKQNDSIALIEKFRGRDDVGVYYHMLGSANTELMMLEVIEGRVNAALASAGIALLPRACA